MSVSMSEEATAPTPFFATFCHHNLFCCCTQQHHHTMIKDRLCIIMSSLKKNFMLNDQDDLVKITTSHNNEEAEMVELADSAEWGPFCQELLAKAKICEAAFSAITLRDHMLISKNELASLCKQKNISLALTNSTQVAVEEAQLAFTKARWIGATYTHWRLAEFDVVQMYPSVIEVPIHLEEEQVVYYKPTLASTTQVAMQSCSTMLVAYFEANQSPNLEIAQLANQIKYEDFPLYFVFQPKLKMWTIRKRGVSVGRIINIHPRNEEEFYLRLLLKNKAGAKSFEDVKNSCWYNLQHLQKSKCRSWIM